MVDAALQVPELKLDGLILRGVRAFAAQRPQQAFLLFAQACAITQNQPELYTFLANAILMQSEPRLAAQLVEEALYRFPTDQALQQKLVECCLAADPQSDVMQRLQVLQKDAPETHAEAFDPPTQQPTRIDNTVDVLAPVYQGTHDTLACLHSLIQAQRQNQTPHHIIVLDDASPDTILVNALRMLAEQGVITHIRQPANLGFIRNMNRGIALHPNRDVVWVNADTLVHGDWLDRLKATAYSANDIASVTPFTNNGELMSFPEIRKKAPMPTAETLAQLDQVASLLNQPAVELPVGCGFCFYQRREAIADVGYLDEATLQRGYGEETDWCLRATSKGWRHMGATHTFVAHRGGSSFGLEKALRVEQNNRVIAERYPGAKKTYKRFVAVDPLKTARENLQNALPPPNSAEAPPLVTTSLPLEQLLHNPAPQTWLIADDLQAAGMGARWLKIARRLRRDRHSAAQTLLLKDWQTPWAIELLATGAVQVLPEVEGITTSDGLGLSGVNVCLTIDPEQPAAHDTARSFNLPLAYLA
jgi:GT2 family glycosyltransferase